MKTAGPATATVVVPPIVFVLALLLFAITYRKR